METLLQNTSLTSWLITILLGGLLFFLRRLLKSFDKMEQTVSDIGKVIIEHKTIVDDHDHRLNRIEDKIFPTK